MIPHDDNAPLFAEALAWGYSSALGEDLTLSVRAGEALAIVGPNGAGKTTLLRTLSGQISPLAGRVQLGGAPLEALPIAERAKRVAVLPQLSGVDHDLSVRELIELGRTPHLGLWGRMDREDTAAVQEALVACDLESLAERSLAQISGGERRRAQVAMCLAQRAPLLLFDEPTTHLDIRRRHELFELIKKLRQETSLSFVLVLHDLVDAYREAERVLVLSKAGPMEIAADDEQRAEKLADAFEVPKERIPL